MVHDVAARAQAWILHAPATARLTPVRYPGAQSAIAGMKEPTSSWEKTMKPVITIATMALAGLAAAPTIAKADYPDRPIRIIVPYTPGGTVDLLARMIGPKLTEAWGQPVVIDNRPGAGGNIGADAAAKSPPDGYTLFLSTNAPLTINVALYKNVKYDPLRDFEPVIMAGETPLLLVTTPSLPVNSVKDLIALAKAKPGEISAGTSGLGTTAHLSLEQFNKMAGVKLTHIPYRGGLPSLTAAVAGEVPVTLSDIVPAMPLVREQRLRALASTGQRRAGIAPDIPTMSEAALPGFDIVAWVAMVAPAGTPKDVVTKLNRELLRALNDAEFRGKLAGMGIDPVGGSAEEFADFLRREVPRWKAIVTDAGITLE
jgi:tripartite-type tricarboxylate transporter receptor subunit TctC